MELYPYTLKSQFYYLIKKLDLAGCSQELMGILQEMFYIQSTLDFSNTDFSKYPLISKKILVWSCLDNFPIFIFNSFFCS